MRMSWPEHSWQKYGYKWNEKTTYVNYIFPDHDIYEHTLQHTSVLKELAFVKTIDHIEKYISVCTFKL